MNFLQGISFAQLLILCSLIFIAGFIDAIAGGGGLISLPAYMMIGLPSHTAIATNKLSSSLGTVVATIDYAKEGYINIKRSIFCIACSFLGSWTGASLILLIPDNIFSIIMIVLLPFIAFYVLKNKSFESKKEPFPVKKTVVFCMFISFVAGMYDGFYGPGTGTFLMILLTGVARITLKEAAGMTKVINLTSNVTALTVFLINGKVFIPLGLIAAAFSICGNFVGARTFTKNGARIARPVTIGVLCILFGKIIYELITK